MGTVEHEHSGDAERDRRMAELEQSNREMREKVDLFARILDGITEMVVVRGRDRGIVYANKAFLDFHGVPSAELIGRAWPEGDGSARAEQRASQDEHVLATGNIIRVPVEPAVRHDGVEFLFHTVKSPLRNDTTEVKALVAVSRNITQGASPAAGDQSEIHRRALLSVIPDLVFRINREGVYLDFSTPTGAETALPPALFLGKRMDEFLPELAPAIMAAVAKTLDEGGVQTLEYTLMDRGALTHYEARMIACGSDEVIAVVRDITAQQDALRTLNESEARFRVVVEQALVGIGLMEGERLVYVNPKLAEMLGYTAEEFVAMEAPLDLVFKDADRVVLDALCAEIRAAEEGRGVQCALQARRKDGAPIDVEVSAARTTYGARPVVVGAVLDITARVRAEEEQRRAQAELVGAQEKVLHELSTPLIPISDRVIVMPLVGDIDEKRARHVMWRLLDGVAKRRARVAILDVTGVPTLDADVAGALLGCARAVRMLGARTLLTGISVELAQTLVELDADLSGIVTLSTLQAGIAYATRLE